jgi:hypothetical protein
VVHTIAPCILPQTASTIAQPPSSNQSLACRKDANEYLAQTFQDSSVISRSCVAASDDDELVLHPLFPNLPSSVPLTYTLTMEACLSSAPEERPSFQQLLTLLADVQYEVALGKYINTVGRVQVRCPSCHYCLQHLPETHHCHALLLCPAGEPPT